MTIFGYHASHEQFGPAELLNYVQLAEQAGFQAAMCSDHFFPWSTQQGESAFAFAWLGAALQATSLSFGSVVAPGQRYHPAIVAQATATLNAMYPGRYWIAVGSGQQLNEHITGEPWPRKDLRNARLRESAEIMRRLWNGERISHDGLVRVDEAQLYTLPEQPPMMVGAAITPATAEWMGTWVDALLTVSQPRERLREVVDKFRSNGGQGKPIFLQAKHSYHPDSEQALQGAYQQWRTNVFASHVSAQLKTPEDFEALAQFVQPDEMHGAVRISAELNEHIRWLQEDAAMGFDRVYLHNVNPHQEMFIKAFGENVLPQLTGQREPSS